MMETQSDIISEKKVQDENNIDQEGDVDLDQFEEMNKQTTTHIYSSPFQLPSDEEVFMYTQHEKQRQQEKKKEREQKQIWEKNTAATQRPLKHFKNFKGEVDIGEQQKKLLQFGPKDAKLISQAMQIIKQRKKNRQETIKTKETTVELLEQKKEMFLVSLSQGLIEKEIENLQETTEQKERALDQSKKMLEKDQQDFNKYLEMNKEQAERAVKLADDEMKEKKNREAEIKQLNIKLTSLKAEKQRNEENVKNYKEYKKFLEKLPHSQWQEQRQAACKEKFEEERAKWVELQYDKQITVEESEVSTFQDQRNSKKQQSSSKNQAQKQQIMEKLIQEFEQKVACEEIDEMVQFEDEYDIFFHEPSQIIKIFDDLEENSLSLIDRAQTAEQILEEIKSDFNQKKLKLEKQVKVLADQKNHKQNQFDEIQSMINGLKNKTSNNQQVVERQKTMKPLQLKLQELFAIFKEEMRSGDEKDMLGLLKTIEVYLNKQLKKIEELKKADKKGKVMKKKLELEKERKKQQKQDRDKIKKEEYETKMQKNLQKLMQPSIKKEGRLVMFRSDPFEKQIVQKVVEEINPEEEEEKRLFKE